MATDPPSESKPSDLLSREELDELMEQIKEGRKSPEVRAEIDREFDRASGDWLGVKKILSRGKLSGKSAALVDSHVDKYMAMLKIDGERPDVRVADLPTKLRNGQAGYAAGSTLWHPLRPYTSIIRVRKNLLKRPLALENTIAHEMVHHRNNLAVTDDEIEKLLETGKLPEWHTENNGHGRVFREGADRINAIMGPDYVTEEGTTGAEEEEERRVSKAEKALTKKIHFGKQLLIGIGGSILAVLVLRKVLPRWSSATPSSATPSPSAVPPGGPQTHPATPPSLPRSQLAARQTNERGHYGSPKIKQSASANERGNYGRPKN